MLDLATKAASHLGRMYTDLPQFDPSKIEEARKEEYNPCRSLHVHQRKDVTVACLPHVERKVEAGRERECRPEKCLHYLELHYLA